MMYIYYNRCTHRLDAYEVIKMAYMNRFINDAIDAQMPPEKTEK